MDLSVRYRIKKIDCEYSITVRSVVASRLPDWEARRKIVKTENGIN